MSKIGKVALAIVLALVFGVAIVVYYVWNQVDPVYQGKRVSTWVGQVLRDEDPAARRMAAEVLAAAIREMRGEDIRNRIVMGFIGEGPLPKEVLPVLLEGLRVKEVQPAVYAAMALRDVDLADAVPALVGALENEADPETRVRAMAALEQRGPWAKAAAPALRAALDDANPEVRRQAASALKFIAPGESGKAGG